MVGQKIKPVLLAFGILCLLLCGGCMFGNVDEMYALPKSSDAYVNLQAAINEEKSGAEYIAPLSGENRQTIQLVDVDGDQIQEAVAFFRVPASETPLKIVIFKQDEQDAYQVLARIEGVGTEIESIAYLDLGGAGACDLLVSWQVSASVHTLVGYTISDGQASEIMRSGYSRYLTYDLDGDGAQEILLTEASANRNVVQYYDSREGILERVASVGLSEGATDISTWSPGTLAGDVSGIFVTSYFGADDMITDILCLRNGELTNSSLTPANPLQSTSRFRAIPGLMPADMNGDGITEVPVSRQVPVYGISSTDRFDWIDWNHCSAGGVSRAVMTTYHCGDGTWYLDLPSRWRGEFAMRREESVTTETRSTTFARGAVTETQDPAPFLVITCFMGADREELAHQEGRVILYADNSQIYTGELLTDGWNSGLNQDDLVARFHLGAGPH